MINYEFKINSSANDDNENIKIIKEWFNKDLE